MLAKGPLLDKIKLEAEKHFSRVVEIRRNLHAHPELSGFEARTASVVASELQRIGLPVRTKVAGYGVVAILEGKNAGRKCIALRADMDALPIAEQNSCSYKSKKQGVMHACGHDAHTASLLGVAMILSELRHSFEGTIKFIFQPSEEKMPSGADAMIRAGVLEDPKVEAIFGMHVHPELEAGQAGFCSGRFMASADEIYLTVRGRGGHAAQTSAFISPLLISAEILLALQPLTDMGIPTVLTFGKIVADGATNVVPDKATLAGTLRCFDEKLRAERHRLILETCEEIAAKHGGQCDVNILRGYPVLVNEERLTAVAAAAAKIYLGDAAVHQLPIRMGSEDFAYYSQLVPSCFYRIGVADSERGINAPIHSPNFDINEKALLFSTGLMSWIALNSL